MEQSEADRLHEGLRRSFADLFDHIEGARLEQRSGYRLVICPRLPFPGLNGIWADGQEESAVVRELEAAIAEVERAACPAGRKSVPAEHRRSSERHGGSA